MVQSSWVWAHGSLSLLVFLTYGWTPSPLPFPLPPPPSSSSLPPSLRPSLPPSLPPPSERGTTTPKMRETSTTWETREDFASRREGACWGVDAKKSHIMSSTCLNAFRTWICTNILKFARCARFPIETAELASRAYGWEGGGGWVKGHLGPFGKLPGALFWPKVSEPASFRQCKEVRKHLAMRFQETKRWRFSPQFLVNGAMSWKTSARDKLGM